MNLLLQKCLLMTVTFNELQAIELKVINIIFIREFKDLKKDTKKQPTEIKEKELTQK